MKPTRLTRRRFLALTSAAAAHVATAHAAPAPAARANTQSLAGSWSIRLDPGDTGVRESWFTSPPPATATATSGTIQLPGILQTQGYGDEITATTQFVAALPRDMRWYLLPQYQAYTKPGHVEVPYLSQPIRHYLGVAWYHRDITVPATWRNKRVALTLERTRWQTDVYVDGLLIGTNRSLVAPHDFNLGVLAPGTHHLAIRIDNRMLQPPYRPDGHSVSDGEGGTWTGIVGRIELSATSPVWIDDAQVFPNLANKSAEIRVTLGNLTGKPGSGTLRAGSASLPVSWSADPTSPATLTVHLPNATPWSEFNPALQHLTLTLTGHGASAATADDRRDLTFGLREIKAKGKDILLNGELFQLRATHDGGGFPLTGYPATDVATWKRIIGICKEWGLNGMRCHSWCPPEAAFTAADQLGFYFAPECGMWNSFDPERKMLAVLNSESAAILRAYGNHPSLVFLNATNEPAGHYAEQLPIWDAACRQADPRRLYSDGTGRFAPPPGGPGTPFAADYLVTPGARGPHGWFGADYEEILQRVVRNTAIPAVGHEVGQWCAYPDFSVIEKFSGKQPTYAAFPDRIGSGKTPYMVPGNYRIWQDSARANNLLANNKAIAHASGRFQLACYKEEIEANLRTPSYSGYELLDLHDYLGQGGALIGLLDAFWEGKSYATAQEFRAFNNTTVPLARLRDRVFTTAQTLTAPVELAHYGPHPLPKLTARWSILDSSGKPVASGSFPARAIPRGKNIPLGTVTAELGHLPAPAAYRLQVELPTASTTFRNDWPFWLYPADAPSAPPQNVLITTSWPEAESHLAAGARVLYLPDPATLSADDPKISTVPIFWNHLMNPRGTTFLGLLADAKHPALAGFPTESNCDWQWVDLFNNTHALNLSALPTTLQPIVQSIDDWNRNLRLGLLYECAVGPGHLIVSSLDLSDAALAKPRPGTAALRGSILAYLASPTLHPAAAVSPEILRAQFANPHPAPAEPAKLAPTSPDLVDPGQIQHRPR